MRALFWSGREGEGCLASPVRRTTQGHCPGKSQPVSESTGVGEGDGVLFRDLGSRIVSGTEVRKPTVSGLKSNRNSVPEVRNIRLLVSPGRDSVFLYTLGSHVRLGVRGIKFR